MKPVMKIVFYSLAFAIGTALIYFLYTNVLLLSALGIVCIAMVFRFNRKKGDFYYLIFGMTFGPLAEVFCINAGAWTYTYPTFLGMPLWLPLAWGMAAVLFRRFADTVMEMRSSST